MTLTELSSWTGILCSVTVMLLTLKRKRALEIADVGPTVAVFLAGTNLIPALYLIYFGATPSLYSLLPNSSTDLVSISPLLVYLHRQSVQSRWDPTSAKLRRADLRIENNPLSAFLYKRG
jgi:hypothetical protein